MRTTFYSALICAVLAGPPPARAAELGPRITFSGQEYDFGKVFAGTIVAHAFVVSNAGDQRLVISNVEPECRCTVIGNWDQARELAPGAVVEIPVRFDSSAFEGEVSKTVAVTSNDKLSRSATLTLRGIVQKLIAITPPFVSIAFPPEASSNATGIVRLLNQTDHDVSLGAPSSSSGSFQAKLRTIKKGREFELAVTAIPPFPTGDTAGTISMQTSLTNLPLLTVTAVAMVQPVLEMAPLQIMLPRPLAAWTTNVITVTNNGSRAVVLSAPVISDPRASLELKTLIPGRKFQLVAAFPPGFELARGQSVQITVNSDSSSRPQLTLPIRQVPPDGDAMGPGPRGYFRPRPRPTTPP